jgi:hypothetical protein
MPGAGAAAEPLLPLLLPLLLMVSSAKDLIASITGRRAAILSLVGT